MSSPVIKSAIGEPPIRPVERQQLRCARDATVVGRIMKVHAAPEGSPWMWTLAFGHHEDCTPTHSYEAAREAAMAASAKSWRRE